MKFVLPLLFLSFSYLISSMAFGLELGSGLAAVDNMGDRAQPAAVVRVGWTKELFSQAFYLGQDFGPVSERQAMLTFGANSDIGGLKFLNVRYGAVAFMQKTSIYDNESSKNQPNPPAPIHDTNYNLGGFLGVAAFQEFGRFKLELNWDSHIYTLPNQAIILIPSARRQTMGLTIGVTI
ncbi:MAG: hypothetical protein NT027_05730 [Proteobacteria bacterium]|nr:hypothetical protein [Pseudomonadota bacterium]